MEGSNVKLLLLLLDGKILMDACEELPLGEFLLVPLILLRYSLGIIKVVGGGEGIVTVSVLLQLPSVQEVEEEEDSCVVEEVEHCDNACVEEEEEVNGKDSGDGDKG